MLFNSYIFIFAFLPLTFAGYFLLNRLNNKAVAKVWLILASFVFYAYNNISYLAVIVASIAINYVASLVLLRSDKEKKTFRKTVLVVALLINIGALFFYKYLDFMILNVNNIFSTDFVYMNLLLPLGISFFTFQQIAFVVDSYKGLAPKYQFLDYTLFVSFFPHLLSGPIVTHSEEIPQFADPNNKKIDFDNIANGIKAFSFGLFKKVIIADSFGRIASFGHSNIGTLSTFEAIITILTYTLQIYFDFSGYCDMASGAALMFNIKLPINFNSPYKAKNIADFWKRWHITLTRFLTRYIYIPLGGNRKGTFRTYINILIVFIVSGLWHGAGYTFLIWGLLHGVASVLYRATKKWYDKIPTIIAWTLNFIFINVAWVYFRAESISSANLLLKRVFSGGLSLQPEMVTTITDILPMRVLNAVFGTVFSSYGLIVAIALVVVAAIGVCLFTKNIQEKMQTFKPTVKNALATVILFVYSVLCLSSVSTFLYFNF